MDDTQQDPTGEEVTDDTAESTTPRDSQAMVVLSLEDMIKSHLENIDKLSEDSRKLKQMFVDGFENNPTFRENTEKVKEVSKDLKTTRQNILNQPQMQDLARRIKEMNAELKEKKNALSDYLLEYQRLAGVTTIEDKQGNVRDIVNSAKAIKRGSKEEKK